MPLARIITRCLQDRILTIPTIITLCRLVLLPFLLRAMCMQSWNIALLLFCLSVFSDGLDGFLARRLQQMTFFGAALDAFTDKLMITACFAALAYVRLPFFAIPYWFVSIIVMKELCLIVGGVLLLQYIPDAVIRPTLLGKSSFVVQALCIAWVLAAAAYDWVPRIQVQYSAALVLFLVVASGLQYSYKAIQLCYSKKVMSNYE